jgi:aminopeptidase N
MADQVRKKKSQGENQNHLKVMKDKAMTANDAEIRRAAIDETTEKLTAAHAEEFKGFLEDRARETKELTDRLNLEHDQEIKDLRSIHFSTLDRKNTEIEKLEGKLAASRYRMTQGIIIGGSTVLIAAFIVCGLVG